MNKFELVSRKQQFELPDYWVFSPSQLKSYMICPYAWYLKYVEHLPETHTFLGTLVGIVFHRFQEKRYKNPESLPFVNTDGIVDRETATEYFTS